MQLVFRAERETPAVQVQASSLIGPGGATIPASAIELRSVEYVSVERPTDRIGVAAEWPDPLPPLGPLGLWKPRAGRNNPLWITLTVPAGARPGEYRGAITLRGGLQARVPVRLRVRDFALPAQTALRSGFGISPQMIARFHHLTTADQIAREWNLYMEDFARHRLAPYNPMILAPFELGVSGVHWVGGEPVAEGPEPGRSSLKVTDESASQAVAARYSVAIPVRAGSRCQVAWRARSEGGKPYLVSLGQLAANGKWISGHNIDLNREGSAEWRVESADISAEITPDTRSLNLALYGAPYSDAGGQLGTAWYTDLSVRVDGGPNLITNGDFVVSEEPHVEVDWKRFDQEAHRYLDKGFSSYMLALPGLGGGRSPAYSKGEILGYQEGTPSYDRLMREFGEQLQNHLASNGWLSRAYVYWYDEPEIGDYPFVNRGMATLHRYFPRLKRMLTEQVEPSLIGGVDLWCPITPNYTAGPSHARQKQGEEVWWYVCTGPKEPYCTLFIDHPAIDLRMWMWQTWKYGVEGILIWETAWWTSDAQFKDQPQDCWADPMSYTSEGSGEWGNGDGRMLYPPRPGSMGPVIAAPIDSMRWEILGEGVVDWEYFRILSARVAADRVPAHAAARERGKRLLTIPTSICTDMTHFTEDAEHLVRYRNEVANAIEALPSVPGETAGDH